MASVFDRTMDLIQSGIRGENQAIPFRNCPKLTDTIYGTSRGKYFLYGAETGVGKTKFVRDQHIYHVYDYYKKINDPNKLDVHFIDFSLEITAEQNMMNAIIRKIYLDDHHYIAYKRLNGEDISKPLSPQELQLIEDKRQYFEEFEKKITIIDDVVTPTQYHDILLTHFRANGKFSHDDGSMAVSRLGEYTPNNPQLLTVGIFDTINLADNEPKQTDKQSIDRISKISIQFRNKCQHTPIIIQQFNADNSDIQRQRHGVKTPMLRDFEDSKRTTKDKE